MTAERPEQHLDEATLADLRILLEAEFNDLIEAFLSDGQQRHADLQEQAQQNPIDADRIRRTAHSFKGSSLNVGATALAALCRQLEDSASAGDLTGAQTLVAEIGTELAELDRLLREHYL
ncbi:Hpt domain-containing protein [Saccharospirillum mangrovi]|uniref:Hpt domain-containing protein n=1 Tax=Saccharospirillum mangrovi TaxID=2161747 RepID=UPI000D397AC7|nr:Hpt domain-containing protein [Saccharospirillum mangrovi]